MDAGPPPVDAGPPPVDAGPPPVDAGPPPVDAGPPDAGLEPCMTSSDCRSHFCSSGFCAYARDCYELRAADETLPDGVYPIDVDGEGDLDWFYAQCDMTTAGGGWTLILNYLHSGGTNPLPDVRTNSLPTLGTGSLGDDGSRDPDTWGHAGNALAERLRFNQTMWFAETSLSAHKIHFVTTAPNVHRYIRLGVGTMAPDIFNPAYTTNLAGRAGSTLPLHVAPGDRGGLANQGDLAMLAAPFYGNSAIDEPRARWNVGNASAWEADDMTSTSIWDTHHQVWARMDPCADRERNFGESDVDCGGACGNCVNGRSCRGDSDCLSGHCASGLCGTIVYAASCAQIKAASPEIESGIYLLDVDGTGPSFPFRAYCDMEFDGGGWTLFHSTAFGNSVVSSSPGEVLPGTTAHMPSVTMQALAGMSSQVHIRTLETEETRSATSLPGGPAIGNLLALRLVENGLTGPDLSNWTGPFASARYLEFTCGNRAQTYPSIYQSCGTNGLHIWAGQMGHSRWSWYGGDRGLNEPLEVYMR